MNGIEKIENDNFNIISDKDKCADCPFNDTSCPGGSWCTDDD